MKMRMKKSGDLSIANPLNFLINYFLKLISLYKFTVIEGIRISASMSGRQPFPLFYMPTGGRRLSLFPATVPESSAVC